MKQYKQIKLDNFLMLSALESKLNSNIRKTTIVSLPRAGNATTKVHIESIYKNTNLSDFVIIYLDINSPDFVKEYLQQQEAKRDNFYHVRFNSFISRQTARLAILDLIKSEYTVFFDSNILVSENWLQLLIESSIEHKAAIVNPLIVMQGGNIHYSGANIIKINLPGPPKWQRNQTPPDMPMAKNIKDIANIDFSIRDIDFAESHGCLVRTDSYINNIEEMFVEEMYNCHTMAVATYYVKNNGKRAVVDRRSMISILPLNCGYDIPWIFEEYNKLSSFKKSYAIHNSKLSGCYSSGLDNLLWHRHHLLHLFYEMSNRDYLTRLSLIESSEIPNYVCGYDFPLPKDMKHILNNNIKPFISEKYPKYLQHLDIWCYQIRQVICNIDSYISTLEH